jgi:hypothetical protein
MENPGAIVMNEPQAFYADYVPKTTVGMVGVAQRVEEAPLEENSDVDADPLPPQPWSATASEHDDDKIPSISDVLDEVRVTECKIVESNPDAVAERPQNATIYWEPSRVDAVSQAVDPSADTQDPKVTQPEIAVNLVLWEQQTVPSKERGRVSACPISLFLRICAVLCLRCEWFPMLL